MRTFLFLLTFSILSVNAQIDSIVSSLRMKPKFGLKMENKNFLLDDQFSRIQEFKPYLEFGNRFRESTKLCTALFLCISVLTQQAHVPDHL